MICRGKCKKDKPLFAFKKKICYHVNKNGERVRYEYIRKDCSDCVKEYNRNRYVSLNLYVKKNIGL